MSSSARGWGLAAAGVLAAFLAFGVIADALAPGPQGPSDSAYATSSQGVAALAELLARSGRIAVPLRQPLARVVLPPSATLFVLGAPRLTDAEAQRLRQLLTAGVSVVVGGGDVERTVAAIVPDPPRWAPAGPRVARRVGVVAGLAGVSSVQSAGEGSWTSPSGEVELAAGASDALLISRVVGRGRLEMLADSSPLQNRLLASADNAQLGLDLAGGRGTPVAFAEALHGFGEATGLAAIPERWWLAFAGLLLAAGVWALSRGRRLGEPELPLPPGAPPRAAFVQAMAGLLLRARGA